MIGYADVCGTYWKVIWLLTALLGASHAASGQFANARNRFPGTGYRHYVAFDNSSLLSFAPPPRNPRTAIGSTEERSAAAEKSAASKVRILNGGEDLQTVLDSFAGTNVDVTIVLSPGYVYNKPLVLRNRPNNNWITVTSAHSFDPSVRVSPNDAANMPKLIASGSDPAVMTDQTLPPGADHPGAGHHYRLIGLEITTTAPLNWNLVLLGTTKETTVADLPHDIYIGNSYIHGASSGEMVRGIMVDGGNIEIQSNYISGFKSTFMEANAIGFFNCTSNFDIENNYLEAAAENLIVDGAGETILNLVPQNITIKHNYFYKPLEWRNLNPAVYVKNLLEFKNGNGIVVDSNIFENNWAQNQNGTAVLFTVRTTGGQNPLNTVSGVHFTNNIVRHAAQGVVMAAYDDLSGLPATSMVRSSDYTIDNNLFDDLSANEYAPGAFAVCFQIAGPPSNLKVTNNTCRYASGERRQPFGLWLVGATTLFGTTFTNNNFNAEIGGDGRYGPDVLRIQPNSTPPSFARTNVIDERNPAWRERWDEAIRGIMLRPASSSGAAESRLIATEQQIKAGTYHK